MCGAGSSYDLIPGSVVRNPHYCYSFSYDIIDYDLYLPIRMEGVTIVQKGKTDLISDGKTGMSLHYHAFSIWNMKVVQAS